MVVVGASAGCLCCVWISRMGGKRWRAPKGWAVQGRGTAGLWQFSRSWHKRRWCGRQAGVMDATHMLSSISLPRGCKHTSRGGKGLLFPFLIFRTHHCRAFCYQGLSQTQIPPTPCSQRVLSCGEEDQVKHGNRKPSGLMAVNYCV